MKTTAQQLHFNVLPFSWPENEGIYYFSKTYEPFSTPIHKSLFPNEIHKIFPEFKAETPDFIYTSFQQRRKGFLPLAIDLRSENKYLLKRIYDQRIYYYFKVIEKQLVQKGFIKENQIYVLDTNLSNHQVHAYDRYSLKVQLAKVSAYPEIVLTYHGVTHVSKWNLAEVTKITSPKHLVKVVFNNAIHRFEGFKDKHLDDYKVAYPVINHQLGKALKLDLPFRKVDNPYKEYKNRIEYFYERFLNTPKFKELIPLHESGFLEIPASLVDRTADESSELVFGKNAVGLNPEEGLRRFGPFRPSKKNKIQLFYIFHKDDLQTAIQLDTYFRKGLRSFKGLQEYAHLITYSEPGFSIMFNCRTEPVHEIELAMYTRFFERDVQYMAIYLTPIGRFEKDAQLKRQYFDVKEALLKRGIASQVIDPKTVIERGADYVYSLQNLAVNMLAKLGGVPWSLRTTERKELVVGVGAFKSRSTGVQYIGSAFCFDNRGKFNRFDCFLKNELDLLVGSIVNAVRKYVKVNDKIERLIIHFYKKMSHRELLPIEEALKNMGLNRPVFIVSINKTESRDIVAFDYYDPDLMPLSGTYLSIDTNRFILFNNTRYAADPFSVVESYPFPVKLTIDCSDKKQLENYKTTQDLINQVYQFSRLYWRSMKQQNLPITIKYPEILARMAPHFAGEELPVYGKEGLWFL
jgi:hypothetical protein